MQVFSNSCFNALIRRGILLYSLTRHFVTPLLLYILYYLSKFVSDYN